MRSNDDTGRQKERRTAAAQKVRELAEEATSEKFMALAPDELEEQLQVLVQRMMEEVRKGLGYAPGAADDTTLPRGEGER
jgi:hypothetical protein